MNKQIILDMVLTETRNAQNRICVQGEARKKLQQYGIVSCVLKERGPAGCAEVRLAASGPKLEAYIRAEYASDEEDAVFHISRIEKYTGAMDQAVL